jgi:transcriptional regulator GlxA family with amidase domain
VDTSFNWPASQPTIGPALAALHDRPAVSWTLTGLAGLAGMSRTLFAARFRAAVGESPMRHLAKIRLGQAAGYLTTTSLSVEAIARRTGYGTNASLSKAFKREFGTSPGHYRETKGSVAVSPARGRWSRAWCRGFRELTGRGRAGFVQPGG